MSVSNIGGIVNIVQGMVGLNAAAAGGFASALARQNQGVAMAPDMIRDILARTDLASSLADKIAEPLTNGATVNAITAATTGQLVAAVVDNNDVAATYVQVFNTAAAGVVLGTTAPLFPLWVLNGTMGAFIFPSAPAFTVAMSWDATTTPAGAVRSTAGKVTVDFVYVA
jgi:hypothetical protein